jgi:tetratricopeptide (TPR) repeat protein
MEASALVLGGTLRAMQGDFVEARHLVARGRALFEELGVKMAVVGCFFWSSEVEELGGDLAAAEAELRAGLEFCQETGDRLQLLDLAFGIARLADLQGHDDDAESLLAIYEETENDDRYVQVDGLCWRARVMARRGQTEEAVRLALEAVALAAPPDAPLYRGAWLIDAAAVLSLAGHHDQATSIAEEALTLYENKGNLVMAGRVQEQLGELRRRSIAGGGANAQPHP